MARPRQIPVRATLNNGEISAALYVGSKEHKAAKWWGGLPGARRGKDGKAKRPKKLKTSICWMVTHAEQLTATGWVQQALQRGQFRYYESDKTYPKHVWYEDTTGQYWFGFCVNGIAGTYKGWPVSQGEKIATFG